MKQSSLTLSQRKPRRAPRKTHARLVIPPKGLCVGTQQALMGLAAFQARRA